MKTLKAKAMNQTQNCNSMSCIYFLGVIGAAIYFISKATSFGAGVLGLLKALVWPAFLVHGALKYMNI